MSAREDFPLDRVQGETVYTMDQAQWTKMCDELDQLRRPPRTSNEYPNLLSLSQGITKHYTQTTAEARDALDDIDSLHAAVDAQSDDLGRASVLLIELHDALSQWAADDDLPDFRQNEARDYARRVSAWLDREDD